MTCPTCFDTFTIDRGGKEIMCPDCNPAVIKLTGLTHGQHEPGNYETAVLRSKSSITFAAHTHGEIMRDVVNQRAAAEHEARRQGLSGRNSVSSGQKSIEAHVRQAIGIERSREHETEKEDEV